MRIRVCLCCVVCEKGVVPGALTRSAARERGTSRTSIQVKGQNSSILCTALQGLLLGAERQYLVHAQHVYHWLGLYPQRRDSRATRQGHENRKSIEEHCIGPRPKRNHSCQQNIYFTLFLFFLRRRVRRTLCLFLEGKRERRRREEERGREEEEERRREEKRERETWLSSWQAPFLLFHGLWCISENVQIRLFLLLPASA